MKLLENKKTYKWLLIIFSLLIFLDTILTYYGLKFHSDKLSEGNPIIYPFIENFGIFSGLFYTTITTYILLISVYIIISKLLKTKQENINYNKKIPLNIFFYLLTFASITRIYVVISNIILIRGII